MSTTTKDKQNHNTTIHNQDIIFSYFDVDHILHRFYNVWVDLEKNGSDCDKKDVILLLIKSLEQYIRFILNCKFKITPTLLPNEIKINPLIINDVINEFPYNQTTADHIRNQIVADGCQYRTKKSIKMFIEYFEIKMDLKELDKLNGLFDVINELKNNKTVLFDNLTTDDLKSYHKIVENLMNILYTQSNIRLEGTFNYHSGKALYSVKLMEQDNDNDPKIIEKINEMEKNRYFGALEESKKILKKDPRDEHAYAEIGSILQQYYSDDETAIQYIDKALELNPNNKTACGAKSIHLYKKGKHNQAFTFIKRAVFTAPTNVFTEHMRLFAVLRDAKRYEELLYFLDYSISQLPDNYNLLFLKEQIYAEMNLLHIAKTYHDLIDNRFIDFIISCDKDNEADVRECNDMIHMLLKYDHEETAEKCFRILNSERFNNNEGI